MNDQQIPEQVTIQIQNPVLARAIQISQEKGISIGEAWALAQAEAAEKS